MIKHLSIISLLGVALVAQGQTLMRQIPTTTEAARTLLLQESFDEMAALIGTGGTNGGGGASLSTITNIARAAAAEATNQLNAVVQGQIAGIEGADVAGVSNIVAGKFAEWSLTTFPTNTIVVFEGDSLTKGDDSGGPYMTYPHYLTNVFWNNATFRTAINVSVGSDTAANMLSTYDTQVAPHFAGGNVGTNKLLVLWAGINDINNAANAATVFGSVSNIVRKAKLQGAKVAVLTVTDSGALDGTEKAQRDLLNANLMRMHGEYAPDWVVPTHAYFADASTTYGATRDGVHFTTNVQHRIAALVDYTMRSGARGGLSPLPSPYDVRALVGSTGAGSGDAVLSAANVWSASNQWSTGTQLFGGSSTAYRAFDHMNVILRGSAVSGLSMEEDNSSFVYGAMVGGLRIYGRPGGPGAGDFASRHVMQIYTPSDTYGGGRIESRARLMVTNAADALLGSYIDLNEDTLTVSNAANVTATIIKGGSINYRTKANSGVVIDLNPDWQDITLSGDLTVTGFSNTGSGVVNSTTLVLLPNGGNRTVTVPNSVRTTDGGRAWVVGTTNIGILSLSAYGTTLTNASFRNTW